MLHLFLTLLLYSPGQAPSIDVKALQTELTARLKDQNLLLRDYSMDDTMNFDANGNLKNHGPSGPWTVYAQIRVKDVALNSKNLRINGTRNLLLYDDKLKALVGRPTATGVKLNIDLPPGIKSGAEIVALLSHAVIPPEELVKHVPSYWAAYFQGAKAAAQAPTGKPTAVAGEVMAGRLVHQVPPEFPTEARALRLGGVVKILATITEAGTTSNLQLVQPAGAGLDEAAIDAVKEWKYKPYLLDGNPVAVETTITVIFRFNL